MIFNTVLRIPTVVALCIVLAACITSRPEESLEYRAVVPMEGIDLAKADAAPANPHREGDTTLDILALSGGGAYGAYGVGVLRGWQEAGTRPSFDIVTGVSTGALTAVFAFLGPQYDDLLQQLFTQVNNEDIFLDKGIAGFFSDSFYDNTPLKKQIESVITPKILAAIAREHAKGRRLYIATTNLDSSELVVWDMGDIANGGRTAPLTHFRKILRASAAVPGFFQPVYIKPQRGVQLRQAHVDGGVKAPVLISSFMFHHKHKNKNLYVIINDSLAVRDASEAIKPTLGDIARKSVSALTRELLVQTVYRGYIRAKNSGTTFQMTYVPDNLGAAAKSLDFNPVFMRKLFDAGRKQSLSETPWLSKPPNIRSFDDVVVVSR